jgi:hypothetical protein
MIRKTRKNRKRNRKRNARWRKTNKKLIWVLSKPQYHTLLKLTRASKSTAIIT